MKAKLLHPPKRTRLEQRIDDARLARKYRDAARDYLEKCIREVKHAEDALAAAVEANEVSHNRMMLYIHNPDDFAG